MYDSAEGREREREKTGKKKEKVYWRVNAKTFWTGQIMVALGAQ